VSSVWTSRAPHCAGVPAGQCARIRLSRSLPRELGHGSIAGWRGTRCGFVAVVGTHPGDDKPAALIPEVGCSGGPPLPMGCLRAGHCALAGSRLPTPSVMPLTARSARVRRDGRSGCERLHSDTVLLASGDEWAGNHVVIDAIHRDQHTPDAVRQQPHVQYAQRFQSVAPCRSVVPPTATRSLQPDHGNQSKNVDQRHTRRSTQLIGVYRERSPHPFSRANSAACGRGSSWTTSLSVPRASRFHASASDA
jgi:hypothetical protein